MIWTTCKRIFDAGVCEQGRVDGQAGMDKLGVKPEDKVTMLMGLENGCGVPGMLWCMGHALPRSQDESNRALWAFILATAEHVGLPDAPAESALRKLAALATGARMNLVPLRAALMMQVRDDTQSACKQAIARLYFLALDDGEGLNNRAVQVSEQAMMAANYASGSTLASEAYKPEYQWQYNMLHAILARHN